MEQLARSELGDVERFWSNYFPEEAFSVEDRRVKLMVQVDDGLCLLPIDFQQLKKLCVVEEFYAALEVAPKEALPCMAIAVQVALFLKQKSFPLEDTEKINIRLHNHPESFTTLKNLKAAYIGRLVSVHGTVVKVSCVRPLVAHMDFSCAKLQEILKSGSHEEGRVPRTVECELTEDLVDSCIPGDVVTVMGIIKVINNYMDVGGGKSKNKNQGLYYLYLEAVSVSNSKSHSASNILQVSGSDKREKVLFDLCSFTTRDLEFVVKFSEEHGPDVFRQMLQSFCPSIYGHELVKAGITLALFGGVQKHSTDQNKVPVRGDIHVLIVGDPGLGKSQLLQVASVVSPRGIYVCGNGTTNAGLTVAVVKDSLTSDYAFEAGNALA
ncbi:hypothetical protein Taro_012045 [Colocasia esculenta]|uniref:MCM C-terminal AAA(+) ATPase domain-containing protein n=1 Tax=Colocasia esculenta TaxID=4460 RepID=A0A843UHZ4_COLES|nr:hypothetical protein [Colocasia esculenta]